MEPKETLVNIAIRKSQIQQFSDTLAKVKIVKVIMVPGLINKREMTIKRE